MPVKILNAARMASQWHVEQRRKGAAGEPYVNHLIEVADLVAVAGGHEDAIIAALLHDAIEDAGITAAQIAGLFGANQLDGAWSLEHAVLGQVHFAHAAGAQ